MTVSTDYTNSLDQGMGIDYDQCGYNAKFRYNIDLSSYGVNPAMIEWMAEHCTGKYGWHFIPHNFNNPRHIWYENQKAFCSFSHKKDAVLFSLIWSGT